MKLTGRDGILRIYDGSEIVRAATKVLAYDDSGSSYSDITSDVIADDTDHAEFCVDADDFVYLGDTLGFGRIRFLIGGGTAASADTGLLVVKYWDGSAWTALTATDGTAVGGNCFQVDGYIDFKIPGDWVANAVNSVTKKWVRINTTTDPATAPDADIFAPVDGQYFDVGFSNMDFTGPLGRKKVEEILVLNRGKYDADGHYIEGSDEPVYEVLELSFSAALDDAVNKTYLQDALQCGDFDDSGGWTTTGVTTKGTTKNDGSVANPDFRDSTKKSVNIQIIFTANSAGTDIGWAYYEVFFDPGAVTIEESEEAVTISATGGIYGVIQRINTLGKRY